MKTVALNAQGDLLLEDGEGKELEGGEEVAQSIRLLLSTNKGEWFLDRDMGMDYSRLHGKPDNASIRAAIIEALGQEPRVDSIEYIDIDQDRQSRILTVKFKVITTDQEDVESEVSVNA